MKRRSNTLSCSMLLPFSLFVLPQPWAVFNTAAVMNIQRVAQIIPPLCAGFLPSSFLPPPGPHTWPHTCLLFLGSPTPSPPPFQVSQSLLRVVSPTTLFKFQHHAPISKPTSPHAPALLFSTTSLLHSFSIALLPSGTLYILLWFFMSVSPHQNVNFRSSGIYDLLFTVVSQHLERYLSHIAELRKYWLSE